MWRFKIITQQKATNYYTLLIFTSGQDVTLMYSCVGSDIRANVKYDARLAVYEHITTKVKNHQTAPTMRPDRDLQVIFYTKTFIWYWIRKYNISYTYSLLFDKQTKSQ